MYTLKIIKSHLDSHIHAQCTAHQMHFIAMRSGCTCSVDCIVLILLGEKLINWIWIRLRLMPRACSRYLYRYKQRTLQHRACIHLISAVILMRSLCLQIYNFGNEIISWTLHNCFMSKKEDWFTLSWPWIWELCYRWENDRPNRFASLR